MPRIVAFLLALVVSFAALSQAGGVVRLRGMVLGTQGGAMSVRDASGSVHEVQVTDATEVVQTQPIQLADIRPGDFLGVTSLRRADGLVATEVRRFPRPLNPGHRPFEDRVDQTMTNATVEATVESTGARELTMTYDGGSQKITVPESAAISTLVPGNPTLLVPGAQVSLTADAAGRALRVQVTLPR